MFAFISTNVSHDTDRSLSKPGTPLTAFLVGASEKDLKGNRVTGAATWSGSKTIPLVHSLRRPAAFLGGRKRGGNMGRMARHGVGRPRPWAPAGGREPPRRSSSAVGPATAAPGRQKRRTLTPRPQCCEILPLGERGMPGNPAAETAAVSSGRRPARPAQRRIAPRGSTQHPRGGAG